MKRHQGRVALVTGGARGIGQAYVSKLAREGASVVIVDRIAADETVDLVRESGARVLALQADVASPDDVSRVREAVLKECGGIDILVNNAGWMTEDSFDSLTYDVWKAVFAINVDSIFLFSKAFVPEMRSKRWGRIINMCSNTLGLNSPAAPHYVASKGAVLGATRVLASALGEHGITVNCISPGLTRTPGTESLVAAPGAEKMGLHGDEVFAMFANMQTIKRGGMPEDLCGAMSFFASDESEYVTGQNLIVDGGLMRSL